MFATRSPPPFLPILAAAVAVVMARVNAEGTSMQALLCSTFIAAVTADARNATESVFLPTSLALQALARNAVAPVNATCVAEADNAPLVGEGEDNTPPTKTSTFSSNLSFGS